MVTGMFTDNLKSEDPVEETTAPETTTFQEATAYAPDENDIALFEECNRARTANGLSPLELDNRICELAKIRCSEQFVMTGHTRPHQNKGFHTVFLENNLTYRTVGENIVLIRSGGCYEKKAVELWMNSPSHRENLLDAEWKYTGICVLFSEEGWYYAVQLFAY